MSNIVIQEFMILANQAVAHYFAENDVPALFRNHTTKTIAPDREVILQDIENATNYPDTFNMNTLRQRVAVSLNRAYYGPELMGHYGLNVPAYVHFTSPIRRYADLVNHRILLAHLKGETIPYTPDQLRTIGEHLNTKEKSIKDARSSAMKERAYSHVRNAAETNRFGRISVKDFSTLIKVAAREGKMTDEIGNEMITRIKNGTAPINDIFMMLLEPQERIDAWKNVHNEIINWLIENPSHATTIATMAKQSLDWPNIEFDTSVIGPDHSRTFTTRATIQLNNTEITSEQVKDNTQKGSQQLATVNLLATIVGQTEIKERIIEDSPTTKSVLGQQTETQKLQISTKNILQEVCQKNGWPLPSYKVDLEGPSHMPTFKALAELTVEGRNITSDEVIASNKKDAEQKAAESLLEKLGVDSTQRLQPEVKPLKVVNDNYIGALQTIAQRNHWKIPSYEVSQVGKSATDGFSCTLTVYTDTGIETVKGFGKNSKEARQKAAEAIFYQISGLQQ
jgi:ribonuclease R